MKITKIRLRSLRSLDRGYGHEAVELEADVEGGDDVDQAIHDLRDRVAREVRRSLDAREAFSEAGERRRLALSDFAAVERELADQRELLKTNEAVLRKYEALRKLAIEQGIEGADKLDMEIPF